MGAWLEAEKEARVLPCRWQQFRLTSNLGHRTEWDVDSPREAVLLAVQETVLCSLVTRQLCTHIMPEGLRRSTDAFTWRKASVLLFAGYFRSLVVSAWSPRPPWYLSFAVTARHDISDWAAPTPQNQLNPCSYPHTECSSYVNMILSRPSTHTANAKLIGRVSQTILIVNITVFVSSYGFYHQDSLYQRLNICIERDLIFDYIII